MIYFDGRYELNDETCYPTYIPLGTEIDYCKIALDDKLIYIIGIINNAIITTLDREDWEIISHSYGLEISRIESGNISNNGYHEGRINMYFKRKDAVTVLPEWYNEGDIIAENAYATLAEKGRALLRFQRNFVSATMIVHTGPTGKISLIDTATGIKFFKTDSKRLKKILADCNRYNKEDKTLPTVTIRDDAVVVTIDGVEYAMKRLSENHWAFKLDLPKCVEENIPYVGCNTRPYKCEE